MIATLTGEIKSISLDRAIIEVGGVGLSVNLTQNAAAHLNIIGDAKPDTSIYVCVFTTSRISSRFLKRSNNSTTIHPS